MPAYKDKERGTYYCKFGYKDWQGKVKQKLKRGFEKERDAKAYERNFLEQQQSNPDMIFSNLVEIYMKDCESRMKPTSVNTKKHIVDLKVLPYFKDKPINKITPADIRKWQNELINNSENYSDTYISSINVCLSAIFNFAIKYYNLNSNPVKVCGPIGKKNAYRMKFWTIEQLNTFLTALRNPVSKVAFNILFWTGIRSGELLALTLNDFDFEKRLVGITKNYYRLHKKDLILSPKTPKSKREVTIPSFICNMVKDYAENLYDYDPGERLFSVTKDYLLKEMVRGCKKSEVERIRVHDLRHSHASLLIEMGFSPLLIAERLGHEKVETTLQTYAHLYPNKHNEVAEKLEELNK